MKRSHYWLFTKVELVLHWLYSIVTQGIQTPVEPGTGQKPLAPSDIPSPAAPPNNNNNASNSVGGSGSIPSATPLQQLPGHDTKLTGAAGVGVGVSNNRAKNILEKFKGNEQYKPAIAIPPSQDSIKVCINFKIKFLFCFEFFRARNELQHGFMNFWKLLFLWNEFSTWKMKIKDEIKPLVK